MNKQVMLLFTFLFSTMAFCGSILKRGMGQEFTDVKIGFIYFTLIFTVYHVTKTFVRLCGDHTVDEILQKAWYFRSVVTVILLFISAYLVGMF